MNVGENSVVRNWESVAFQPRLLPPSPTLALWDGDSSWDCCRQEHRTPSSLPPARGFSCWEEQDFSMSHPVPSSLLLKLSPQWLCGEVGAAFPPAHGMVCQEYWVSGHPCPNLWGGRSTPGEASWGDPRLFLHHHPQDVQLLQQECHREREVCHYPSPQLWSPSSDFAPW